MKFYSTTCHVRSKRIYNVSLSQHTYYCIEYHGIPDFELGRKKLSPQVTTDSDTVFREESIGEGFKIVTVAVLEKILLFEKKLVRL